MPNCPIAILNTNCQLLLDRVEEAKDREEENLPGLLLDSPLSARIEVASHPS